MNRKRIKSRHKILHNLKYQRAFNFSACREFVKLKTRQSWYYGTDQPFRLPIGIRTLNTTYLLTFLLTYRTQIISRYVHT